MPPTMEIATMQGERSGSPTALPETQGLMIHLLQNNQVAITSELDSQWSHIHPNCYAPACLSEVHLLAGGGSGTTVFEGHHPVTGDVVMKHGGPKDMQEVFSLSLIAQQLQKRGAMSQEIALSAERMKKRIPEFVMVYLSPFHLRDRSRERWSRTVRHDLKWSTRRKEEKADDTDDDDSDESSDEEEGGKPGSSPAKYHAVKKYIPRRIHLVEVTDEDGEVALDVYFNHVTLEVPVPGAGNLAQNPTIEKGHVFLAKLLEELVPVQQDQNWKFTVAQKKIGGATAQNGAFVLTSGSLKDELLERLIQDFICVMQDLRQVTLPNERTGVESVREELQELQRTRDVTAVSKRANAFVGSAIKKNFAPGAGRFPFLRDIGERFRMGTMMLTKSEQVPAAFLGTLLEPQVDMRSVFCKSPAPKSALDYVLEDDYWLDLLEHAASFEHPSATDRIWTCGLADAGLHNLFLCHERGVELFDLGEPQLSPQPAFLTKFFMSFFHALGMEENKEGTSWVRRFCVVENGDKLDLTLETQDLISYCHDAFTVAVDQFVDELFEGDDSVRELIVKYVVLQLLSDAAFCLARWEEKGGGKNRYGARAMEGLDKWLWRSLWDLFIACDVQQKLLVDGSDSLLQGFNQSFIFRSTR